MVPPSSKRYPDWLSDLAAAYVRKLPHRGQGRVLDLFERLSGRRRWNARTNHGFRVSLDRGDMTQWHILKHGEWDAEVAEALSRRWSPDDVFYDIGANIGFFSLQALAEDLRFVVAFEPFAALARLMSDHVRANGFAESRYRIEPTALGAHPDSLTYMPGPPDNSGAGKLLPSSPGDGNENDITVKVETLDGFLARTGSLPPTICKLDVEGFEREVLEGARTLLGTSPPHTIVFEADCDSAFSIADKSLVELLTGAGYRIEHLARDAPETKENFIALHSSSHHEP